MRTHPIPPIAATLLAASLASAQCTGGAWVPVAPLTTARQETGAARLGGSVYVLGGLVANPLRAIDTVEVYSIASNSWSFAPPMPAPLDHLGVAVAGGLLYAIGGFSGNFAARSQVYVYNPQTLAWSPGPSLPQPRGGCWAVSLDNRIYVFGGVNAAGQATRSTFILDPATGWTAGADMPTAREHLTATDWGAYIYVIGGRAGAATNANERYHPATNSWTVLAPMPTARSATATVALPGGSPGAQGRIYVAGGEIPVLHAVNEVYDIATNAWSCQAPMAIPRHGVAAVSLPPGDRILVPAGGTIQGLAPTAAADLFIPACYPNCDASTGSPLLNVNDFVCFQSRFAAAHPYADCDANTFFNVMDFVCFQAAFAAGCR